MTLYPKSREARNGSAPSHFSFLCDPRGQLLGAQEESLLSRLFEARERNDLLQFGGHFPTDPELLRPIAYPHRPGPRSDFLQRLIAKLVQVRVAILIPPEPCQAFDLPPYLTVRNVMPESESSTPGIDSRVIHMPGPDPPNSKEIVAVAAAASDSLDLIARLKPFFPRHDVAWEYRRYEKNRKKADQPCTAVSKHPRELTFVKWMLNASVPIAKGTQASTPVRRTDLEVCVPDQPELDFAERPDPRFLAEFAQRKMRRAG